MGSNNRGRSDRTRQHGHPQKRSLLQSGPWMEEPRDRFLRRPGIHLWAALVLVSVVPDFDFERHHDCLSTQGLDANAGGNWRAKRLLRHRRRMAPFRNVAARIPASGSGCETALWQYVLFGWYRGLRANRSDRSFCLADLRRRIAVPDDRAAGSNWLRLVPKAHAKQNGYSLWA